MKKQDIYKSFFKESSLSRVWKHVTEHDSGTISAFRYASDCGSGKLYSKKENKNRNAKLKAQLLSAGYGVTAIDGVYIENYGTSDAIEVREESFIVVDIKDKSSLKKDLMKLGEQYEQDSITFSKPSGDYILVGTNKCPNGYPGYKKEIRLGKPLFGDSGEFHSKINGRPFVFKEALGSRIDILSNYSISEIRSIKHLAEESNKITLYKSCSILTPNNKKNKS